MGLHLVNFEDDCRVKAMQNDTSEGHLPTGVTAWGYCWIALKNDFMNKKAKNEEKIWMDGI